MRLVLLSLALLASNVAFGSAARVNSIDHERLDPIQTGASIPDAHKIAWRERHRAWDACEKCDFLQPFPGDS